MDSNVIKEYIDFIQKQILKFYKIVLDKQYDAQIIKQLIERYIMVRYYDETNYPEEKDFVERISKELSDFIKTLINENNEEKIKNIHYLFGYIFYFDDCYMMEDVKSLTECLENDENIKITISKDKLKEIEKLFSAVKKNKVKFKSIFASNQFFIEEKLIKKKLYLIKLEQNVRISNLYSEYAIKKAFNSGSINEDKLFVTLLMANNIILQNAIDLDFTRYYFVEFVPSLFEKEKKLDRLFKGINNTLSKKHLILTIYYQDYIENKEKITSLIKEGYSFAVIIDSSFEEDFRDLILFSYVLLPSYEECHNFIIENKEKIQSEIIII